MIILYTLAAILLAVTILLTLMVYLAPGKMTAIALYMTHRQSGLTRKELVLADGTRFVYLEGGDGEPLMMLHGFGGNKDSFTRVARYLVPRYRLIIPDIIGFGESAHPPDADYASVAQAERLRTLAQVLNISKVHLAGNSMGGQIALVYAARYPGEVLSLWLLSPSGFWSAQKTRVFQVYEETGKNLLIAHDEQQFKQIMELGMYSPPYIPKPMLKVLARERIENVSLEEKIFPQLLSESLEHKIEGVNSKTLVMFGEYDRVISVSTADLVCKLLPNAKAVVIKNAGHVSMFDQPLPCAREYLAFRFAIDAPST